jgi:Ser/Thr protein kinase RdoA (MazF antagonist)
MESHNVQKILEKWHIGPVAAIEPTPFGEKTLFVTTADNGCFVLKETHDRERSQREYALLQELSQAGVSVLVAITLLFTAFWLDIRNDEDAAKNTESLLYWLSDNRQTLVV